MNKKLILIVVLLIPIAVFTKNESEDGNLVVNTEYKSLEVPIETNVTNDYETVMVSANRDKSEAFAVDLEDYIVGVVAGEMPASFNMEALKAQAVAARTYALYKNKNNDNYVLSTTVSDQVYLTKSKMESKWGDDFSYYYNRIKEAVQSTKGEVLTYNGDIAITYYFAISNGFTDDASFVFNENKDYLVSVESSWDKNYSSYSSTFTMNKENFCSKLDITCDKIEITNLVRADNHYVRSVTINGKTFTGIEVFNKLNLKSHDFEMNVTDAGVVIKTYGFGHGIGMSQYGAQGMASSGYNYVDILKHYYQNTEIAKI